MRIAVLYSFEPQAGIIDGFKNLGHQVECFYYGKVKVTLLRRLEWKIFKNIDKYFTINFNNEIQKIYKSHKENEFDLLLIIKGKKISKSNIEVLKSMNSTFKILWTTDSVIRFPEQLSIEKLVDKVYVQDGVDVNLISNSEWLPLGFDSKLYKKINQKDIDILFFGNCDNKHYKLREKYFVEASKLGKQYNIKFVGSNLSKKATVILRNNEVELIDLVPFSEFTSLVSRSKIAINIHQDDGDWAINPLFFAIPACGTIQVTDIREYYNLWLETGTDFYPVELKHLNNKLKSIISNFDKYKINVDKIINQHSFKSRAKKLLENKDKN